MKKIILTQLFALVIIMANAQVYSQGSKNVNLGIAAGWGVGLAGSVDYGLAPQFSVGVGLGTASRNYGFIGYSLKERNTALTLRGSFHFANLIASALKMDTDKFDAYIGLSPGFRHYSYAENIYGTNGGTTIIIGGHLGARYTFSNKLGLYAEIGRPYTSAGLTVKF